MNMTLKVLSAIALISITIAAGVIIYKNINPPPPVSTTVATLPAPPNKPQTTAIEAVETPPTSNSAKPKYAPNIEIPIEKALQPAYVPINQASYLQNLRMEGKEYHSSIIGKVAGQASKKDWGIKGTAYFTYLYGVKSVGKILKNDGTTIIEERKFGEVIEDVIVSRYEVGFEIPPIIGDAFSFLTATAGAAAEIYGSGGSGVAGANGGYNVGQGIVKGLNQVKIPFTDSMFADLRTKKMLPPELDPEKVKNEMMMFSKIKDGKMLEGKTVQIIFKDGQGVTSLTPINCELSEQERDVIKRTNFVLDHYIFPDRKVSPGDEWAVDGDVFAGFLDPRLHGKVGGNVTVSRISDFNDSKNRIAKRLKLLNGKIVFTDNSKAGQSITGQLSGIKGSCVLPDDFGVITSASMSGFMEYKNVSTDHLLFDAAITVTPRFNVEYQCEVK